MLVAVFANIITLLYSIHLISGDINNGACFYRKLENPGSIKFLVIAGIRSRGQNGSCGEVSRSTLEQLVALEWILPYLNGQRRESPNTYMTNMTLGYDLYDNCDSDDLTIDLLYSRSRSGQVMDCSNSTNDSTFYIGAISLTTPSATAIMSRLLEPLPVLRPLMSSPLLQSRDQPNLLQTVVPFKHEVMALVKMLQYNKWNFIVAVHTDEAELEAQIFMTAAREYGICIDATNLTAGIVIGALNKSVAVVYFGSEAEVASVINQSKPRPYGSSIHWIFPSKLANRQAVESMIDRQDSIISIHSYTEDNVEFMNFLLNPSSAVLEQLSQNYQVQLPAVSEIYPEHMADAVFVLAKAANDIWKNACSGQDSSLNCIGFQDAVRNQMLSRAKLPFNLRPEFEANMPIDYKNKTIQFLLDGTQTYPEIYIYWLSLISKLDQRIGNFTSELAYVPEQNIQNLPTSACNATCSVCQEQIDLRYSYLHGDFLIVGLFSLRQYGDSTFSCGHIRHGTSDIITVSSFLQSVRMRRNQTGISFGAVAIDDCYNGFNTSHYLAELFSKRKIIRDPNTNESINFDNVISIIGALSSPVTLVVADLATSLRIPMISYGASSPDLDNRNRNPYFLRTVPSDTLQALGMVDMITRLGVSHVGLVYINDAYGQGGKLRLLEEAAKRNICVETPISVSQDMDENYVRNNVVRKLYDQQVRVVLFFGIDVVAKSVLDVMQKYFSTSFDRLVFISSEGWGTNQNLVAGDIGQISKGAIIFNTATRYYDSYSFKSYLEALTASKNDPNRWIPNLFEDYNNCDFVTSFEKTLPRICGTDFKSTLDSNTTEMLYRDQRGVHTMLSVFAVTDGYEKVCKLGSNVCSATYVRSKGEVDEYLGLIKNSLYGGSTPIFDTDGNGNVGFTIYNIQLKNSGSTYTIQYEEIGTYTKGGKLQLTAMPKFYDDLHNVISLQTKYATEINCFNYATCSRVCPSSVTQPPTTEAPIKVSTTPKPAEDSSLKTLTIIFGVFLAVLMVALIFVVVVLVRIQHRQTKQLSERGNMSISLSDVHTVYDEPACVRNKEVFDNPTFTSDSISLHSRSRSPASNRGLNVDGSMLSLNRSPIQYARVQQLSNPESSINHVRQISNQELISDAFDPMERPMSAQSMPAQGYRQGHRQKGASSPLIKRLFHIGAAKQKTEKQKDSPKTPHSAPHGTKQPVCFPETPRSAPARPIVYRPSDPVSPKFRYPSTSSTEESHYAMPKTDSSEELQSQRKMGVSDDNIHEHFDLHSPYNGNGVNTHSNVYPQRSTGFEDRGAEHNIGREQNDETDAKIIYKTAKDFMFSDNDEEDDAIEDDVDNDDATVEKTRYSQYTNEESQTVDRTSAENPQRVKSLTSPSDEEVKDINFPPSEESGQSMPNSLDSVSASQTTRQQNNFRPISEVKDNVNQQQQTGNMQQNVSSNRGLISSNTHPKTVHNALKSSISDVPDIIKHGPYEEDNVFII